MNEPATKEELQALVNRMRQVADSTYAVFFINGMGSEVHAFLEFNGLIQKYVDICSRAAEAGIDFRMANTHSGTPLPVEAHDIEYMAEKLDCIFGPALADGKLREVFLMSLFGLDVALAARKQEAQKKLGEEMAMSLFGHEAVQAAATPACTCSEALRAISMHSSECPVLNGPKLKEGWGWPMLSRKCHYFRDGRALCGKWLYTGEYTRDTANASPDDCAACFKKRQRERQKVTT